jgi:hypothetical protein
MSTRPPPPPTNLPPSLPKLPRPNMSRSSYPFAPSSSSRPSPWDTIDLSTVDIVDLTDSVPTGHRRRASSSEGDRPSKRAKGKQPAVITLDDEDEESEEESDGEPLGGGGPRLQSPSHSGSLSDVKCVICLDSPTDLASTPCGTPNPHFAFVVWFSGAGLMIGHVFCDFCIRSAMKAGSNAQRGRGGMITFSGACPICRRKITTKSLIPLEIKVRS